MQPSPSEWRPPAPRPSVSPRPSTMSSARPGTSWRACPLNDAWDVAVARRDNRCLRCLDRVASEWNRVVHPGPFSWLRRGGRTALRFSTEDYAAIVATVAAPVLDRTLNHIESLRRQRRLRLRLHAVALLEAVETAVAIEAERRRGGRWPELPGNPPATRPAEA